MKRLLKIYIMVMVNVAVMGAPVGKDAEATITNYEFKLTEDGYIFEYATSNGITRKENGEYIKDATNDDNSILRVTGTYSYIDNIGNIHEVSYGGDENGSSFRKAAPAMVSAIPPSIAPAIVTASAFPSVPLPEEESERFEPYAPKGISTAALASLSG